MTGEYLIQLVEEFCRENNLEVSLVYKKIAKVYQDEWGINIDKQMRDNGKWDIVSYLEEIGIVDRYVHILNGLKNMIKNNWDLELDKL